MLYYAKLAAAGPVDVSQRVCADGHGVTGRSPAASRDLTGLHSNYSSCKIPACSKENN